MKKIILSILAVIGTMTSTHAQSFIVYGTDGTKTVYSTSQVNRIEFNENNSCDGHEYVDLGLPSGTLWATCNIGAENPEDYGLYFAWGETNGYAYDTSNCHSFDWENYKWGSKSILTKYNEDLYVDWGCVSDNKTTLDAEDDAATINWGANWRMPDRLEMVELYSSNNTYSIFTTVNGIQGYLITSKFNGKKLFLPAAGKIYKTDIYDLNEVGLYWSRSRYISLPTKAKRLKFYDGYIGLSEEYRCYGYSIRPVLSK